MSLIGDPPLPLQPCYDDPHTIYTQPVCLMSLSKNVQGNLILKDRAMQTCDTPSCTTLKTIHSLTLEMEAHDPCEEEQSSIFTGKIIIARLVTAFKDNGLERGFHAGDFQWNCPGEWGSGRISGVTNAGTHRDPVMNCQDCYSPGYMEGRICAHFALSDFPGFQNCDLMGTYWFKFDSAEGDGKGYLTGVIEAVVIRPCQ